MVGIFTTMRMDAYEIVFTRQVLVSKFDSGQPKSASGLPEQPQVQTEVSFPI